MNKPVNIDLLTVTDSDTQRIQPITELQIFGVGNSFHPQGLFSTEIFGAVGSEFRSKIFAYIDIHHYVLHPVVYKAVVDSKAFYKAIIDGNQTAVFNAKTKEFEKSSDEKARTGYAFFMSHFKELKFLKNDSDKRSFNIDLIEMSAKTGKYALRYLLVMPAAMRDYTVTPDGKPEEDEINTFYRRILSQAQLVDPILVKKNPEMYDAVLAHIQVTVNDLFEYLQSLLDGKNKLILGKWLSRKVFNSTRNVLTAPVDNSVNINDPNRLRTNDIGVGLYQFLRATAPKSLYRIKNTYTSSIFVENSNFALLTNVKTLLKEEVLSTHVQKDFDRWMTMDGLESVIASYGSHDIRDQPILLNHDRHYIGLIYNDGKHVKFLQSIADLPEHLDKANVSPINLTEYLYLSVYMLSDVSPGLVTRYPINGYGGIYPAWMKLRTTSNYITVVLLDDEWKPSETTLNNFPVRGSTHVNGMTVHQSHMGLLGADFDGDTVSLTGVLSDESNDEVTKLLNSPGYYLNNEKRLIFSNSTDVINAVLTFLTAD